MSKLQMPLPYISHSQLWLFEHDPEEYYQQYFVARVDEPTDKMIFGKIFQEAWSDPKCNWRQQLKDAGFNGDKTRVIETALAHKETVRLPKSKTEKRVKVKHPDVPIPLLAIFDGKDDDRTVIVENKMGLVWKKDRVESDAQLTWYILCYKLKYGRVPKLLLQCFNARNGIPTKFWVKRTQKDFDDLITRINNMITRVEAGDFTKY